ncbi:uncharacterized protein LOC132934366 [Metopolophium dirhodum]|uniref:uncharacterized protein LOC132934366 n=1 Tax=Metopolophium dirhodum TaxID=44670 RepID=UPI0029905DF1|nr:uncharacterized protein LOC132934366 [Metopolophium dirhodum]
MSLSKMLKLELEKDLLHKHKNKNCKDNLLQLDTDQIHKQLLWIEHNFKVCPQLKLIHLIYLTIKNSATENVTCYDIERKIRYWFPYYCKRKYIKTIYETLSCMQNNCQKYFYRNSSLFMVGQDYNTSWTINSIYISTLEESLMKVIKNYEDEIKSEMAHPDQLSMILNGYGVHYLGST